ncbi:hypothetical protein V8F06_003073 [Rhypophila decipiens]
MPPPKQPLLPFQLLKELGVPEPGTSQGRKNRNQPVSRKDRRKAERNQQKAQRVSAAQQHRRHASTTAAKPATSHSTPKPHVKSSAPKSSAPKPILKKTAPKPHEDDDDFDGFVEEEDDDQEEEEDEDDGGMSIDLNEDDESSEDDVQEFEEEKTTPPSKTKMSKTVKDKLANDDAEIAHLEKMLGLKGRKSLPKSFMEDGLGDLLDGLDEGVDGAKTEKRKRKAEADEWLAQKRRKATEQAVQANSKPNRGQGDDDSDDSDMDGDSDLSDGLDGLLRGSEGEGSDEDDEDMEGDDFDEDGDENEDGEFGGFDSDLDSETEAKPVEKRVRENPYVAPTTGQTTVKYVPPSLRKETGSDAELAARIRRQTQGLINRITESNLLGIVGDIEKLYRENPRQHVSSSLVDLLLTQVCEPTSLPDTLLILIAGFATAVYKVIGMDLGAQLIQDTVERFDKHHEEARLAAVEGPDVPKHTSNLITFLAQLYNFQMIGPKLLFDYIRLLLSDLSELNAELLLRIVRMSGPALKRDDDKALKDIVSLIRPAVAKIGEKNLSVRTKFMIETINDLKDNKMKTGAVASAVVSEHATRMKKLLGSLNSKKLKSSETLGVGLNDIRNSDKKGKWWLVGASWAGPSVEEKRSKDENNNVQEDDDEDNDSFQLDSEDEGQPDLAELAREQGMNTDVRRSIFVSLLSSLDYEDAYYRILKLRLNKEQKREIANVIVQLSGAEKHYNPYYALVAKKFCIDHRSRWSFQDTLWRMFRRLGESLFEDDAEDEDEDDVVETHRFVNVAKLYGTLVASGHLSLAILKCLNLAHLQTKAKAMVEILLITVLQECQNKSKERGEGDAAILKIFGAVEEEVPELATGLLWFIRKVVRKTDLVPETKRIKEGCKLAEKALQGAAQDLAD